MQRNIALVFVSALLAGLSPAVHAASHPIAVPMDSFINRHVDSVAEMSRQVTLDPVVRRRLARHFHVSGPAMVHYIQDNLVLRKTTKTRRYQVYCLSRSGREYTINARLPLGTPVFVLSTTGEPILKLACGNPMVSALPVIKKAQPSAEMASLPKPARVVPAKIVPKIAPQLASKMPIVLDVGGKSSLSLMSAPVTKVAGGLYELPAASSHFPLGFLAALPVIAGLTIHNGGSNSGTPGIGIGTGMGIGTSTGPESSNHSGINIGTNSGTGTVTGTGIGIGTGASIGTTGGNTEVTPVPEPSTSAAFVVGGAGIAILLAGARRRKRAR